MWGKTLTHGRHLGGGDVGGAVEGIILVIRGASAGAALAGDRGGAGAGGKGGHT
jgi:hypothetical protein